MFDYKSIHSEIFFMKINTISPQDSKFTKVLNDIAESDLVMKELLMDKGFPLEFSEEVLKETALLSEKISDEEISKRKTKFF